MQRDFGRQLWRLEPHLPLMHSRGDYSVPRFALYAAIALSTSLMFDVAARAATPDSVLIFCGTMALMIYVIGTFARKVGGFS